MKFLVTKVLYSLLSVPTPKYYLQLHCVCVCIYSRTPRIQINWDGKSSGYAENPDNWIFFKKKIRYIGSLKWKKMSTNCCFRLHIYLHTYKILVHSSLCVFDN
jgi:hypothetical protein